MYVAIGYWVQGYTVDDDKLFTRHGAYATSGRNATLLHSRIVNAEPGVYGVSGQSIALVYNRQLNPSPGIYSYAGVQTDLVRGSGIWLFNVERAKIWTESVDSNGAWAVENNITTDWTRQ